MTTHRTQFASLIEALRFVSSHGQILKTVDPCQFGFIGPSDAAHAIQFVDGAVFMIEAYCEGPYSETTPDTDYGVRMIGIR